MAEGLLIEKDSTFIHQFERRYNIQLNNWIDQYTFSRSIQNNLTHAPIQISPNLGYQSGVSLAMRYVTLSVGFQLPHSNNDIQTYGRTDYFNFLFSYFQSKIGIDVYAGFYNGLYAFANNNSNLYEKFPNASLQTYGLNIIRNFNHHKFSYRSAISLAELQHQSSGAFLFMANVGLRRIQFPDVSFIPASYYQFTFLHFKPGYAYNFCFKNGQWFIMPSLFAGLGISSVLSFNPNDHSICFEKGIHSKFSAGYNGTTFFANVFGLYDYSQTSYDNNTYTNAYSYLGINIGYRFKHLIRGVKWL